jgi:predicted alpha/beta hydrolase family esterase
MMLRHTVAATFVLALTACGQGERPSETSAALPPPKPMFVLMGGYTTCDPHRLNADVPETVNPDIDPDVAPDPHRVFELPKLMNLLTRAPAYFGVTPNYIVSCYSEQNSSIYYFTSDAQDVIRSGERPDFIAAIEERLEPGSPIYLIGHSHGGWLSMKTDSDLAARHQIKALFSIDPISRTGCTTSIFTNCMSAPRDIGTQERQLIKSKTEHWTNFYQTQTLHLRSSAIDQATRNLKVAAAHTEIQLSDAVWNEINAVVYR